MKRTHSNGENAKGYIEDKMSSKGVVRVWILGWLKSWEGSRVTLTTRCCARERWDTRSIVTINIVMTCLLAMMISPQASRDVTSRRYTSHPQQSKLQNIQYTQRPLLQYSQARQRRRNKGFFRAKRASYMLHILPFRCSTSFTIDSLFRHWTKERNHHSL